MAQLPTGFSGADLVNLCNEAALGATGRNAQEVALIDFIVAVERIVAGLEKKNRVLNPREREVGACHEMDHVPAGHRHRPQGVHHAARHRGAGLRHSAAHRRPLSHDRARLDVPGLLPSGWQPSQDTQQHIDAAVRQIVMTGPQPCWRKKGICSNAVRVNCWSAKRWTNRPCVR